MSTINDYNLAAVQTTLGTFRVTGWAEGDACSLAPMGEIAESVVSADGAHTSISRVNDPRWEATLKVARGTKAFRLLMEALQAQLAQSDVGAVDALAFQVYDPVSGDKITEANARFLRYPDMPFGKAAGDAEFKLLLPNPTVIGGANIATS